MEEIRVLSPTGACGAGYLESSFEAALALAPHFIGMDAGSTDPGPSYLGSGCFAFPQAAVKRDIRIALKGARRLGIPLILGSCGTAGGDTQLAAYADIVREIAAEDGLAFKMALIHSEQDKDFLLEKLRAGPDQVPLDPAPPFERGRDRAQRAHRRHDGRRAVSSRRWHAGAEVVLAGRSSDTAIFASFP